MKGRDYGQKTPFIAGLDSIFVTSNCSTETKIASDPKKNISADSSSSEEVTVPIKVSGTYIRMKTVKEPTRQDPSGTIGVNLFDELDEKIDLDVITGEWRTSKPSNPLVKVEPRKGNARSYHYYFDFNGPDLDATLLAMRQIEITYDYRDSTSTASPDEEFLSLLGHGFSSFTSCDQKIEPFKESAGNGYTLGMVNRALSSNTVTQNFSVVEIKGDLSENLVGTIANTAEGLGAATSTMALGGIKEGALYEVRRSDGSCEIRFTGDTIDTVNLDLPFHNRPGFHSCDIANKLFSIGNTGVESTVTSIDYSIIPEGRLFWIDFNGQMIEYPEGFASTFEGHPWLVTNAAGECQTVYIPVSGDINVIVPAP